MAENDSYTVRVKRGTANEWAMYNPILGSGELGYDTTNKRLKVGDGLNVWSNLTFSTGNSYDLAKDAGFVGTLSEWLKSLKGKDGEPGKDGVGPTNHLEVGEVKTGSEPAVEIRGESPNQIIDFTFPSAGDPIEYSKATATKDGLMPKEDKATLDGVTTFGKDWLTVSNQAAGRTVLGLSTGATTSAGSASELNTGTSTTNRVWQPKVISDFVSNEVDSKTYPTGTTVELDSGTVTVPKMWAPKSISDYVKNKSVDISKLTAYTDKGKDAPGTQEVIEDPYFASDSYWDLPIDYDDIEYSFSTEQYMPGHKRSFKVKSKNSTGSLNTIYSPIIKPRHRQKIGETYVVEGYVYISDQGSVDTYRDFRLRVYNYPTVTGGSANPNSLIGVFNISDIPRGEWVRLAGLHTPPDNGNDYAVPRVTLYRTDGATSSTNNEASVYFGKLSFKRLDLTSSLVVNAKDFGALGDGINNDAPSIRAAIGDGNRTVIIPEGVYGISNSILVPSNTVIKGSGINNTTIKMLKTAQPSVWGFTNSDRPEGNEYITISSLTIDGNFDERSIYSGTTSPGGGSRGSGITLGNVDKAWITNVKTTNTFLHGIDITCAAINYPYDGDNMAPAVGPSRNIWIESCETENFGDDGITTHHSEYLHISNCYSHTSRNFGNNNGIEIDDGSRYVTLSNNTTKHCYGGVEIKAHADAPAPWGITINGHLSIEDCRSYNWRHIGHHSGDDPVSPTASGIIATNLVSVRPNNSRGYYEDATPRALVISAYNNVTINGFYTTNDGANFGNNTIVAIQYRASNVTISGMNLNKFNNTEHIIYIGSSSRYITFNGPVINNCGATGINAASTDTNLTILGGIFRSTSGNTAITMVDQSQYSPTITGTRFIGYATDINIDGTVYSTIKDYNKAQLQALLA